MSWPPFAHELCVLGGVYCWDYDRFTPRDLFYVEHACTLDRTLDRTTISLWGIRTWVMCLVRHRRRMRQFVEYGPKPGKRIVSRENADCFPKAMTPKSKFLSEISLNFDDGYFAYRILKWDLISRDFHCIMYQEEELLDGRGLKMSKSLKPVSVHEVGRIAGNQLMDCRYF
jgi:hypothetical protein